MADEAGKTLSETDKEIALLIRARFPIVSVVTHEERHVLMQMEAIRTHVIEGRWTQLSAQLERATVESERLQLTEEIGGLSEAHPILRWSVLDGLSHCTFEPGGGIQERPLNLRALGDLDSRNPIELLAELRNLGARRDAADAEPGANPPPPEPVDGVNLHSGLFVFCDLHLWLDRDDRAGRFNHILVRALRDIAQRFKSNAEPSTLILLSPRSVVPIELNKEIQVIDYPLPTLSQMRAHFEALLPTMKKKYGQDCVRLDEEERPKLIQALCGLTYDEADNVLARSLAGNGNLDKDDIHEALDQKKQIIRKDGTLDYFDTTEGLEVVGGLEHLLKWLDLRRRAFEGKEVTLENKNDNAASRTVKLPVPKGILLIGVPGCGKSLVAKAVGSAWGLPLLRLDIGKIFAGTVGHSEENMRRAIRIAESVAPAIMWLDEVEKAFPKTTGAGDSGVSLRVMNTFLTWLQEKTASVFVIATGNDIQQVPVELSRKGRFDEIFYVGLPNAAGRQKILEIHATKYGLAQEDKAILVEESKYFTGAEIELCVHNSLYVLPIVDEAEKKFERAKHVPESKLARAILVTMRGIVPLAHREEQGQLTIATTLERAKAIAIPAGEFEELPKQTPGGVVRKLWFMRSM